MAPDTLVVHVSRDGLHSVEPAVDAFETSGPFDVEVRNHGRAVHVHCNVDDEFSRAATLSETNHYVETESSTTFRVAVAEGPRPVAGHLRFVTAYGAGEATVPVTVREPTTEPAVAPADVGDPGGDGESAAFRSDERVLGDLRPGRDDVPVLALAGVAVLVAVIAVALTNSTVVLFGVGAVVLGVLLAFAVLLR